MKRSELKKEEVGEFYWRYISLISEESELIESLEQNTREIADFLGSIPSEKWLYRYEPEKWSILEMIQHLIDTERIFQYRALCFARNEKNPLPGFDHDSYVVQSEADKRSAQELIAEFKLMRSSGIHLFKSFSEEVLKREGNMNGVKATPRAIGFIMPGHALHHMDIIRKRYL